MSERVSSGKAEIQPQGIREMLESVALADATPEPLARQLDAETAVILVPPAAGEEPVPVEVNGAVIDVITPEITRGASN